LDGILVLGLFFLLGGGVEGHACMGVADMAFVDWVCVQVHGMVILAMIPRVYRFFLLWD